MPTTIASKIKGHADFEIVVETALKPMHPRPLDNNQICYRTYDVPPLVAAYRRKPCESRPASKK